MTSRWNSSSRTKTSLSCPCSVISVERNACLHSGDSSVQVPDRRGLHPPATLPRHQKAREGPQRPERGAGEADIQRRGGREGDEGPQGDVVRQVRPRDQPRRMRESWLKRTLLQVYMYPVYRSAVSMSGIPDPIPLCYTASTRMRRCAVTSYAEAQEKLPRQQEYPLPTYPPGCGRAASHPR